LALHIAHLSGKEKNQKTITEEMAEQKPHFSREAVAEAWSVLNEMGLVAQKVLN